MKKRAMRRTERKRHPGGRPSKYSASLAARICRDVRKGCSREAAASLAGINADTLYSWRERFPEFSEALQKADAQFERSSIAAIRRAGRRARNWPANAWLLERKFPYRFGRIDRHTLRASHEGVPLPAAYIEAINRALGMTGKLEPLDMLPSLPGGRDVPLLPDASNGDGEIDLDVLDVLPQG